MKLRRDYRLLLTDACRRAILPVGPSVAQSACRPRESGLHLEAVIAGVVDDAAYAVQRLRTPLDTSVLRKIRNTAGGHDTVCRDTVNHP